MTQPPSGPEPHGQQPFDQYGQSMRPVNYPLAGPPPPYPGHQFPGQMRNVDQFTTAIARPKAVVVAFVLWLLAALSWPVGTVLRTLSEDGFNGFGTVMTLFFTGCLGIGGVLGAVAFMGGSYHARLALVGASMVIGVLALAAAIVAARDGGTEALSWVVIVSRLVLPTVAAVCSFLPGTRHYFAGNLG
jgi:hypothetical protein